MIVNDSPRRGAIPSLPIRMQIALIASPAAHRSNQVAVSDLCSGILSTRTLHVELPDLPFNHELNVTERSNWEALTNIPYRWSHNIDIPHPRRPKYLRQRIDWQSIQDPFAVAETFPFSATHNNWIVLAYNHHKIAVQS